MKKCFLITSAALLSLSVSAQQPDTIPGLSNNIDTIPNKGSWNSADSTGWNKTDTVQRWHKDPALTGWDKHDSIMKRQADSTKMLKADSTGMNRSSDSVATKEKLADRAIMKDGEMMVIKNGVTMKMEKDITLPSGTIIKVDGTVRKKDGSETKLKDGQYIALPANDVKKKNPGVQKREMPSKKKTTVNKKKQ